MKKIRVRMPKTYFHGGNLRSILSMSEETNNFFEGAGEGILLFPGNSYLESKRLNIVKTDSQGRLRA